MVYFNTIETDQQVQEAARSTRAVRYVKAGISIVDPAWYQLADIFASGRQASSAGGTQFSGKRR